MIRTICRSLLVAASVAPPLAAAESNPRPSRGPLDPLATIHIPIGMANTVDTLKTFVEAEGSFSPGCGSYGVYFWLLDRDTGRLVAPTMPGVRCTHGLSPEGDLIPWSRWSAREVDVTTTVCQVLRDSPAGRLHIVGAKAALLNRGTANRAVRLFATVRALGPAGSAIHSISVSDAGDALVVEHRPALVCAQRPGQAGVAPDFVTVGQLAERGQIPAARSADSATGDAAGAVAYDLTLQAGETTELGFVCPVLPGRRAVGHRWDGTSPWAQFDLNTPNPPVGGELQPDPGLDYYRRIPVDSLFADATKYWRELAGRMRVTTPDPRWSQALAAIVGHAALEMNEGAPDVTVVNYNVFNRDGVYVANILQKCGRLDLAEQAIDYFLTHPFNGRVQVEADNPGQVLWIMGQHWLFARDRRWLDRIYPAAAKLAAMIRYYRTTPPPHFVKATSLEYGNALPPDRPDELPAHRRQVLKPGSCDGHHPEYTAAFDIAGLRAAAQLARAAGSETDAGAAEELAARLLDEYGRRFGARLPASYGSYCVLWPCRLYPVGEGRAYEQFRGVGAQTPTGWRYFPLATAHQGLLAGNRAAGWGTLEKHLAHEQMAGWYAFDEGGRSGAGGWRRYRTRWNPDGAMPHGWAIAELWLLMRDALAFEDGDRLVLFAGVPAGWFTDPAGITIENLPTHFGPLGVRCRPARGTVRLEFSGDCRPPAGFALRLPADYEVTTPPGQAPLARAPNGDVALACGRANVEMTIRQADSREP